MSRSLPSPLPGGEGNSVTDVVAFTAPLQIWTNDSESSAVGFVILPADAAERVAAHELMRRLELGKRRGFGSVKVTARLGASTWDTSVFPQKGRETWFMAVKVAVRRAEGVEGGEADGGGGHHDVAVEDGGVDAVPAHRLKGDLR